MRIINVLSFVSQERKEISRHLHYRFFSQKPTDTYTSCKQIIHELIKNNLKQEKNLF